MTTNDDLLVKAERHTHTWGGNEVPCGSPNCLIFRLAAALRASEAERDEIGKALLSTIELFRQIKRRAEAAEAERDHWHDEDIRHNNEMCEWMSRAEKAERLLAMSEQSRTEDAIDTVGDVALLRQRTEEQIRQWKSAEARAEAAEAERDALRTHICPPPEATAEDVWRANERAEAAEQRLAEVERERDEATQQYQRAWAQERARAEAAEARVEALEGALREIAEKREPCVTCGEPHELRGACSEDHRHSRCSAGTWAHPLDGHGYQRQPAQSVALAALDQQGDEG